MGVAARDAAAEASGARAGGDRVQAQEARRRAQARQGKYSLQFGSDLNLTSFQTEMFEKHT